MAGDMGCKGHEDGCVRTARETFALCIVTKQPRLKGELFKMRSLIGLITRRTE